MQMQSLSSNWQFREVGTAEWLSATVPGSVHTDLFSLKRIPDPFFGDNEKAVAWVAETDWEYRCIFTTSLDMIAEQVFLVADGLDTVAEVSLNGIVLGSAHNQFRQWRWEIKEKLSEEENTLSIRFSGPAAYAHNQQKRRPMRGVDAALPGAPHMRKAPCQFGWDWGPQLPPIGIWKDIRLEGFTGAKLEDTHIRQLHSKSGVTLTADVAITSWDSANLTAYLEIASPDGQIYQSTSPITNDRASLLVEIDSPQLWWPNGLGSQFLYPVELTIQEGAKVLDQKQWKIGLRTIELRQESDEWGQSFQFVVNGVPFFAKGSNWIPADSFITRFSDERLEKLIADAAASHQNMLRVWGGGFYEEERFYDLCDQYGMLVWQDFVFSCSIYPMDDGEFMKNVQVEVAENIRRLRHRASLALWCGNNEMEWGWEGWGWAKHPMEDQLPQLVDQYPALEFLLESAGSREVLPDWEGLKAAYDQFFHKTLPGWVLDHDPDTPYWPSSPSSDTPFHDVNSQSRGDAHYWDVWHGRKPFTAYRDTYPRFMSEFGFQAFPNIETIDYYAKPQDRNLTSYIMEHHQRGNHGNGLIISQMTDTFRMPENFPAWIYLSLILQAEGIRYGVEHWRRNMHRVAGTLYWQLNDCWPVASWASIDYFGRWKALHYAAKRFYSPILLSVEDKAPVMDLHITSDLTSTWTGSLQWSLETLSGEVLGTGNQELVIKPLSDTLISSLNFEGTIVPESQRNTILIAELNKDNERVSLSVTPFVPTKHLELQDPQIEVEQRKQGDELIIELTAQSLARFVELKLEGVPEIVFSDNYFDIPAGRTVEIRCPIPKGWTSNRTKNALRIYSLYDSFSG